MTTLKPSHFLTQLLSALTKGLSHLNHDDPAIRSVLLKIMNMQSATGSSQINGEELLELLRHLKEIIDSYGITPQYKAPKDEDEISKLPSIIYNTIEEVDHLIIKEQVMDKTSLSRHIDKIWNKLAHYHSARR